MAAEGPFNGVLAFSQGAGLAAMHIVRKAIQAPSQPPPFKFAVFMSCSAVYNPEAWLEHGGVRVLDPKEVGQLVQIPTTHIWGKNDHLREQSGIMKNLCNQDKVSFVIHDGGHEVPRTASKQDLLDCVKAIRRTITRASI